MLRPRGNGRLGAATLVAVLLVGGLAVAWTLATVVPELEVPSGFSGDFRVTIWEPGRALLAGENPIGSHFTSENGGVYPPAAVVLTLPFALLPYGAAASLWLLVLVIAVLGAMFVCGVRDWRCFALALASPPVLAGLAYGNISLLVVLGVAVIWARRERPWQAGMILGIVLATRLFPWPLLLWLLFTRRLRSAGVGTLSAIAVSLLGFAAVGFQRVDDFLAVTHDNTSKFVDQGVSVASIVANLGGSQPIVAFATCAAGATALVAAWRHRHDDLACFSWTIAATLMASPIVWGHYFALMLVPLALSTPALSRNWLLPYLTAPQLTASPAPGGKILDALTGVCFTVWTALESKQEARPQPHAQRLRLVASDRVPEHSS